MNKSEQPQAFPTTRLASASPFVRQAMAPAILAPALAEGDRVGVIVIVAADQPQVDQPESLAKGRTGDDVVEYAKGGADDESPPLTVMILYIIARCQSGLASQNRAC
jgi:hypothetical protein